MTEKSIERTGSLDYLRRAFSPLSLLVWGVIVAAVTAYLLSQGFFGDPPLPRVAIFVAVCALVKVALALVAPFVPASLRRFFAPEPWTTPEPAADGRPSRLQRAMSLVFAADLGWWGLWMALLTLGWVLATAYVFTDVNPATAATFLVGGLIGRFFTAYMQAGKDA
jgi:hypothetical protein